MPQRAATAAASSCTKRSSLPAEQRQLVRCTRARQFRRRVVAAQRNHLQIRRQLFQQDGQQRRQRRASVLQVVEHQRRARRQLREQAAAVSAREDDRAQGVIGREQRQRLRQRAPPSRRQAQVVEEAGRVGVGRVDLHPQCRALPGLQPTGHERSLAGAGRRGEPQHRRVGQRVELSKQAFAWQQRIGTRCQQLGQPRRGFGQRCVGGHGRGAESHLWVAAFHSRMTDGGGAALTAATLHWRTGGMTMKYVLTWWERPGGSHTDYEAAQASACSTCFSSGRCRRA